MNARHTPSLESLLERHREGGAFPTYAELSAIAAPAAPSEQAPNGFVLMPTEINAVVKLGWAYLDAAREDDPSKSWSFSHTGYRAMVAAAAAPAAPLPAQPESLLIRAYNSGYKSGHHDTVEGQYTDIDQRDMFTYHADVVADMIADGTLAAPASVPQLAVPQDLFDGDDAALCDSIHALLAMDQAGALVPHGIGGHARTLLATAALRLASAPAAPLPELTGPSEEAEKIFESWDGCLYDGMDIGAVLREDFKRCVFAAASPSPAPARQQEPSNWRRIAKESAHHLEVWLEQDDCECEGGHTCGKPLVQATLHDLKEVLSAAESVKSAETAAPGASTEPQECWSANNEEFNANSLDELLDQNEDLKPGNTVWCADAVRPELSRIFDADDACEMMGERAYDIAGESADDYPNVTKDQRAELGALIHGWILKHAAPNFWMVKNVKPYILSTDDFPDDPAPVETSFFDPLLDQQTGASTEDKQ